MKTHAWRRRLTLVALGLAYALCTALACPPFTLWWLGVVAPVPAILAGARIASRPTGKLALLRGAGWFGLGAAPLWAFEQRWVMDVSVVGYAPLVLILSVYTALATWGVARCVRSLGPRLGMLAGGPTVWAGVEFFRGEIAFGGYPWYLVGEPVIESHVLAAAGAIVGVFGVGLLVAGVGSAVAVMISGRWRSGAIAAVAWVLVWAGGCMWGLAAVERAGGSPGDGVRFGIVQTNVPQSVRGGWPFSRRLQDAEDFLDLSAHAVESGAEVLVWPETMFPGDALERAAALVEADAQLAWRLDDSAASVSGDLANARWLASIPVFSGPDGAALLPAGGVRNAVLFAQRTFNVPMVIGAAGYRGYRATDDEPGRLVTWDARFNSVFVLADGAVTAQRYDKLRLTPFGEVMPYASAWPWLESQLLRIGMGASGMTFDLDAGRRDVALDVPVSRGRGLRIATPICFEGTIPGVARRLVAQDGARSAGVLVQITNDGWFGAHAGGRAQHLRAARWRAIETGTPLVRAANTGISAGVDRFGRVLSTLPNNTAGTLVVEVEASSGPLPPSVTIGDAAGWLAFAGTLGLLVWSFVQPGGQRQEADA